MDSHILRKAVDLAVSARMGYSLSEQEIHQSISQIGARWMGVLDYHERKAIARMLGGNRYAKTAQALLDAIFEGIVNEDDID